ncbi:NUDIX domain-containing protein [Candidatus Saccharibacteria bacterium]|nr:NUDIX domain-containing protein [Candidatus Saccharibacteria bacterium]
MPGIEIAELRRMQGMPPLPKNRDWNYIDTTVYRPIEVPRAANTPEESLAADFRFPDDITASARRLSSYTYLPVDPYTRLPRNPRGATGSTGGVLWNVVNRSVTTLLSRRAGNRTSVLLVQLANELWAPPGGFEHPGESTRQAGDREVLEETGVKLDDTLPFIAIKQTMTDDPRDTDTRWVEDRMIHVDASSMPLSALHPTPCDVETIDARWFPLRHAPLDEMSSYFANRLETIRRELGQVSITVG